LKDRCPNASPLQGYIHFQKSPKPQHKFFEGIEDVNLRLRLRSVHKAAQAIEQFVKMENCSGSPFSFLFEVASTVKMSNQTFGLDRPLYDYLLSVSLREPEILQQLRQETAQHPMCSMQIAPEQGQFMALLVQLIGAKKTLEVGVFTGYSSLVVALALPPDGKVVACDVSEEYTAIARRYWQQAGVADKIDLHIAPAVETLDRLLAEGQANTFDFAFIDADKSSYEAYYERSLQLVRPGGLLAIDNVLWSGQVADPQVQDSRTNKIRALNQKLHQDERISLSLVPIADGLTLARKLLQPAV
jgi:predicted O-methyltransferase YrrM